MTEVPEHLLQRSRERRAALGLESGGAAPAGEGAPAVAPSAASPAPSAAPPADAATTDDMGAEGAAAETPATPVPALVGGTPRVPVGRARRVPMWMMPVLIALPIWALVYAYALDDTGATADAGSPLAAGREIYEANCASCHLSNGAGNTAGGVGQQLNQGQVVATFPDVEGHVDFVRHGSPAPGTPYGSPDRAGGQRVARGGMPPWERILTDEELAAVVAYEREGLR